MYPISYPVWDWRQTGVAAGPARAQAMMETSLVALKEWYGEVVDYQYVGADGVTVSVGDSMPIMVGETGWKARQTNPASEIEQYAALPPNAKWYFDLLYGNPGGYAVLAGLGRRPADDFLLRGVRRAVERHRRRLGPVGHRAPGALCPVRHAGGPRLQRRPVRGCRLLRPAAVLARSPSTRPPSTTRWWASAAPRIRRSWRTRSVAPTRWRASTGRRRPISLPEPSSAPPALTVGTIPFDAANTRMTVRVYSPAAGIRVRLKVEDSANTGARRGDRGSHHHGQRLGDADLRLRRPGRRLASPEPGLRSTTG